MGHFHDNCPRHFIKKNLDFSAACSVKQVFISAFKTTSSLCLRSGREKHPVLYELNIFSERRISQVNWSDLSRVSTRLCVPKKIKSGISELIDLVERRFKVSKVSFAGYYFYIQSSSTVNSSICTGLYHRPFKNSIKCFRGSLIYRSSNSYHLHK